MSTVQIPVLFDFSTLLPELRPIVIEFAADRVIFEVVNKAVFSNEDIKGAGQELVRLSQVCHEFRRGYSKRLVDIKMIFQLYHKYRAFGEVDQSFTEKTPCGNTQLLDLLGTGNPNVKKSFMEFTETLAQDMEQIIKLMPRSVTCNQGRLFGQPATPLVIACCNTKIPIQSIELLLQKGANPNTTLIYIGQRMHLLTLIKNLQCPSPCPSRPPKVKRPPTPSEARYEEVKNVLEKYGAVEEEFNGEGYSFFTGTTCSPNEGGFGGFGSGGGGT